MPVKKKKLPKPHQPKSHQSDQKMLWRVLRGHTEALASTGEPRPTMRWETRDPSTCSKRCDSDWRIIAINTNSFPSEKNGLEKAKYDLLKKTVIDSEADIVGITELGRNEDNIPLVNMNDK